MRVVRIRLTVIKKPFIGYDGINWKSLANSRQEGNAMRAEDLVEMLRKRSFGPFRIHMTDGQTYDIVHPEAVLVLRSRAVIGLRPDPETKIADRSEDIALIHVVRISAIPAGTERASSPTT